MSTLNSSLTRRRFLGTSFAAGAGLAGAALVGCSAGGGTPSKPAASNEPAKPAAGGANSVGAIVGKEWNYKDANAVVKYGGTLNLTQGNPQIPNLDPLQSTAAFPHYVASFAYSALMKLGRKPEDRNDTLVFPDIATSWEIGSPTKWTFKIRQGVKWHNIAPVNGRAMTIEDVKYAVERSAFDKGSPFRGVLKAIKSVEAPDASTLVLNLSGYDPTLFLSLADRFAWITPKELGDSGKLKEVQIGTGPFVFQKWEQDTRIAYKKNPDYFIKGVPFVDELNMLQVMNAEARLAAFKSGSLHAYALDVRDWRDVKEDKKFETQTYIAVGANAVFMNYTDQRWKDDRVRKAMSMCFDREVIVKVQSDGEGVWRGIMSAQNAGWALSQDELKSNKFSLRYSMQDAKQLMTAAGFANGMPPFNLYYDGAGDSKLRDTTAYLGEQAVKAGVTSKLNLVTQDRAALRKNQDEHKFDGLLYGADGEPQAELFLLDLRSDGPKNGSGINNAEWDKKIDAVFATIDTKERQKKAQDLEREFLGIMPWKLNFTDNKNFEGWGVNVKNWQAPPPQQYNQFGAAYTWIA